MDVFTALSDPTRRRIVESLAGGERAFGDIAADFPISRPAVSQHLKVLRTTGLVMVRRDAQRRIYRLDDATLAEVEAWVARTRRAWAARLDRLESVLHETPDDTPIPEEAADGRSR